MSSMRTSSGSTPRRNGTFKLMPAKPNPETRLEQAAAGDAGR